MSSIFQLLAVLEPVGKALQDLIKFWLVNIIDTKNKTLDSLLNTFLLAIMAAVVSYAASWSVKSKLYMWRMKHLSQTTTDEVITMYDQYNKEGKLRFVTWNHNNHPDFTTRVVCYYLTLRRGTLDVCPASIDPRIRTIITDPHDRQYGYLQIFAHGGKVLYYSNSAGVVFLTYNRDTNKGTFAYSSEAILNEVYDILDKVEIQQQPPPTNKKEELQLKIYERHITLDGSVSYTECALYPDRNFNSFVSIHKEMIIRRINNFIAANEDGSSFGGLCTYNLGILLHGVPGTGKTLLMKCVANMLKRDAVVVDMRQIKSKETFRSILNRHPVSAARTSGAPSPVYCFDEFDCIQGVIKRRHSTSSNADGNMDDKQSISEIDRLKEQYLTLLQSMSDKECSKDYKQRIEQEMDQIKKQMSDIENGLTLDSILTVLDGVVEYRGRVIIACTNHLDQIDDALLRPGRFDLCIHLDSYTADEIRQFLRMIYPNESSEKLAALEDIKFPEHCHTPAEILNIAHCAKNIDQCVMKLCSIADNTTSANCDEHTKPAKRGRKKKVLHPE